MTPDTPPRHYPTVLSIAGSDSGGGAGIQADIKAVSACGSYALTALTAVTAQNTQGVTRVEALSPAVLREQLHAVLSDIGADAVKIGMLHSAEIIEVVREMLLEYKIKTIILDPVMVATSGDKLLQDNAVTALKTRLIPLAEIITPNIPEAEILLGETINAQDKLPALAQKLSRSIPPEKPGPGTSVLLKAGHFQDSTLTDIFYNAQTGETLPLTASRISTPNTHGTGCTLSSAVAAYRAQGQPLTRAVRNAKHYLYQALLAGRHYRLGQGSGPVHHFYRRDQTDTREDAFKE